MPQGKKPVLFILFVFLTLLFRPVSVPTQEVLRGEVLIDLEPIYAIAGGTPYPRPIDANTARMRALEEAVLFFSAMIYGWSFHYEIGEKARGLTENLELEDLGTIKFGDPAFSATDLFSRDGKFSMWADYRLSDTQRRRAGTWRSGSVRNLQALGYSPLFESGKGPEAGEGAGTAEVTVDWIGIKRATLEDAAKSGLKALFRGTERNRPREARGYIALAEFPRFFISHGQWAVSARFRLEVREIIPFAVY
ncbi:MAG: hypothetical protein LBT16_05040 [Treponema sp.]|jgi:hypothetical protein|nr:hypothetical protein [Treponema sp.]